MPLFTKFSIGTQPYPFNYVFLMATVSLTTERSVSTAYNSKILFDPLQIKFTVPCLRRGS